MMTGGQRDKLIIFATLKLKCINILTITIKEHSALVVKLVDTKDLKG